MKGEGGDEGKSIESGVKRSESHKRREKGCLSSFRGLLYIHQRASVVHTRDVTRAGTDV